MKALSLAKPLATLSATFIVGLLLSACSAAETIRPDSPQRIVSLDYCADQYVLEFASREHISALSPDAAKRFSYMRAEASGIPQVRPRTADILALEPDLVVRSYGGDPGISDFLERAGVPVIQLGYPQTLEEVRREVGRIGSLLGASRQAKVLVDDMDRRLSAVRADAGHPITVLYMTPGGVSAGRETLIDELFQAAGMRNYLTRPGWHDVPLEQMAYRRPDLIAAAFYESSRSHTGSWSAARHPLAQEQLRDVPVVSLEGAWTSCGGWFLIEAIEALAKARRKET